MASPRWLDDTQQQAWRALITFTLRGLPQLEGTLKAHGLLVVHYGVLAELSDAPDGTMRLSDLANAANLSPSRLTHRMRSLVERGVVDINADPTDGRSKHATLTAAGRDLLEAVAPLHVEDVRRVFFDHLDSEDTEHLAIALSKVAWALSGRDDFASHDTP